MMAAIRVAIERPSRTPWFIRRRPLEKEYAVRAYRLKSGIKIRGSWGWTSSIKAEDKYVSSLTLENLKDRAVVIFQILLEVDRGYFIELEDRESEPLILGPFEAFHREYEPIDRYSVNMSRIRMDGLLADQKVRKRLVLATSQGRYNITGNIDRWYPTTGFFHNRLSAYIRPLRSTYDGKAFGSGTKYVVDMVTETGQREVIPIYPRDHEVRRFENVQLTAESLESKEALETYLLEHAFDGKLQIRDLKVLDLEEWRSKIYKDEFTLIDATPRGWWTYHVLGPLVTRWENRQTRRLNRWNQRRRKKRSRREKKKG